MAIITFVLASGTKTAYAADPLALGTVSGTIPGDCSDTSLTFPAFPADHPSVIAEIQTTAPVNDPSDFNGTAFEDTGDIGPGTVWLPLYSGLQAGVPQTFSLNDCRGQAQVVLSLYDVPTTPTTFSGQTTSSADSSSELDFTVPGGAAYVAAVTLSSAGALSISSPGGSGATTVASSQTVQLGYLNAGNASVYVSALDGPEVSWSLRIAPVPVSVSALRAQRAVAEPQQNNTISYTLSADAVVSGYVLSPAGKVVRTLAQDVKESQGNQSFVWDGTDSNSNPVPDGIYTVQVGALDYAGNPSVQKINVRIADNPLGGSGTLSTNGHVGPLRLGYSTPADVVQWLGPAQRERGGNFGAGDPNFESMEYGCGGGCQSTFFINSRTGKLVALSTGSTKYVAPHGLRVGTGTSQAEDRAHQRAYSGCGDGFGLVGRRSGASLFVTITGGHTGSSNNRLYGGRISYFAIESNRNPVGLLFC
jgi:hypothetical protein